MTEEELEKAKFYLNEAHIFFEFVQGVRKRIDEKIYNMIVVSGVLVNVVFGLGFFLLEQGTMKQMSCALWALVFSASSYLLVTIMGLFFYRPQDVGSRNIKKVIEKYERNKTETEFLSPIQHVAWNLSCDAEANSQIAINKGNKFWLMLVVFAIGLVFLLSALVLLASGF